MLLLDANISPKLVGLLRLRGIASVHWVSIGESNSSDAEILQHALLNDWTVVTCDLDFTAILSNSKAKKPSVIQVRMQAIDISQLADLLAAAVLRFGGELSDGAVLSLDTKKARVRLLPLA